MRGVCQSWEVCTVQYVCAIYSKFMSVWAPCIIHVAQSQLLYFHCLLSCHIICLRLVWWRVFHFKVTSTRFLFYFLTKEINDARTNSINTFRKHTDDTQQAITNWKLTETVNETLHCVLWNHSMKPDGFGSPHQSLLALSGWLIPFDGHWCFD